MLELPDGYRCGTRRPAPVVRSASTHLRVIPSGTILQRLGQVLAVEGIEPGKVGQGARHFEDAMGGAQRQAEAFAGLLQPVAIIILQGTMLTQSVQVEKGIG